MKRLLASILVATLSVAVLAGCGKSKAAGESSSIDKITMTYVTAPLNMPSIVDKNEEIFSKELNEIGVGVEYVEITSGADQTQALASGDVQVLYGVGATSVILAKANGADIKILNTYSRSPEAFCMYTADKTIASPEDLRGKKIAGPVGTNLHELLSAYLASADMTLADVEFLNMTIPDTKAALDGGSIDVALLAGATAYQAEQQGYQLVTNGKGYIDAIIAVAVTEKFYKEHKDIVDAVVSGQEKIATYMGEHSSEAAEMVAKELDLEESAVTEMLKYYDFNTDITEADKAGLQKTADFMLDAEMIENSVDVNDCFIG